MKNDEVIRVRAPAGLKVRLESIAALERRKLSDFLRLILEDFCDAEERKRVANQAKAREGRYPELESSAALMNEPKRRKAS